MARKATALISWVVALGSTGGSLAFGVAGQHFSYNSLAGATALFLLLALGGLFIHKPNLRIAIATVVPVLLLLAARWSELGHEVSKPSTRTEALYLIAQIVVGLSVALVSRRQLLGNAINVMIDGFIIGLGAWVVMWVTLVHPLLDLPSYTTLTTTLHAATLACTVIVLFLLTTLLFADTAPSTSATFLGLAIVSEVAAIILRSTMSRGDISVSQPTIDAIFLIILGCVATALLHPSLRHLASSSSPRHSPALLTRLVTTTLALIIPVLVVTLTDPKNTNDRLIRTVSISVLALAVMVRVVQSVRQNVSQHNNMMRSAMHDSLTGLPSRVLLLEHVELAVQQSWRTNKQPSVLYIDVDRFKAINDSLGHSTGDAVLTCVSDRLTQCVPEHAIVARISGDEFVVLDPNTETPTQAVLLAEHILDSLRSPIATSDGDTFVTASIGVAYVPKGMHLSADDVLRHADTAMYRAKNAGRNCIALFDDSMLDTVTKRLDIETALYRALERHELHLVHQPIVDIQLGLVVGFEALMRWDRGADGYVAPVDFIPVAEETGTIVPLGSWAIQTALSQLRAWIDTSVCSPSTTMSVNVSPRQLHDPQFVSIVSDALAASGIPAEQLWLEVTESVMISEPTQALSSLRRLHNLGVRIAIDDFGTGYSSLSLLQAFPIECIKVDRSFVQNIATSTETRNLVKTIIAMANALNCDIVAEGIENTEQLRELQGLQCTKAQGYLISKPVNIDDVPSTVRHLQDPDTWKNGAFS
jgi:diguanylate cyclase (GGDEF)-like protein